MTQAICLQPWRETSTISLQEILRQAMQPISSFPTVDHMMQMLPLPFDIPSLVLPGALVVCSFGTQGKGFIAVKHHGSLACWSLACCCSLARRRCLHQHQPHTPTLPRIASSSLTENPRTSNTLNGVLCMSDHFHKCKNPRSSNPFSGF